MTAVPLKIGLVGGWGHESVRHYPGAHLAWACDHDERALERAAAGGRVVFRTMDELIECFRPDVIYVGTVFARNGVVAAEALERGFPVVCEKPLAADRKTLERLERLTDKGGRVIAEFAMRWSAPFARARELVAAGQIGDVVFLQARKSYKFGAGRPDFYQLRETFGGIIPWVASHAIDFAAWSAGLSYRRVTAHQGNRCFPEYVEMEDHAVMLFEMSNGSPCAITADFLRPDGAASHGDNMLHLTGTQGVIEVRNSEVTLTTVAGVNRWMFEPDHGEAVRRAVHLVHAALGENGSITTGESLHITRAALAARLSADRHGVGGSQHSVPVDSADL